MVIKTLPGNAHVIGVLFDELDWKEKNRMYMWK